MIKYEVNTMGRVDGTYRSEKSAVARCGEGAVVVMVARSGTYESRTVIHPNNGNTHSN